MQAPSLQTLTSSLDRHFLPTAAMANPNPDTKMSGHPESSAFRQGTRNDLSNPNPDTKMSGHPESSAF